MAEAMPFTKECSACCDEKSQDELVTIEADLVCRNCICRMFHNAVEDESNYPPRWGKTELTLMRYGGFLRVAHAAEFLMKQTEYDVPWDKRVYCGTRKESGENCPEYLGQKTDTPVKKLCLKCHGHVCMCCKERVSLRYKHTCDANAVADEKEFKDLVKGKDWQKCPTCHTKLELKDGCNHVLCPYCQQSLCFVCGQPAAANSNHWSKAKASVLGPRCPRYNQPGDENAMYQEDAIEAQNPQPLLPPPLPRLSLAFGDFEALREDLPGPANVQAPQRNALRRASLFNRPRMRAVGMPAGMPDPRQTFEGPRLRAVAPVQPQVQLERIHAHHRGRHPQLQAPASHQHHPAQTEYSHTHQRARHTPLQQPSPTHRLEHPHAHHRGRHGPMAAAAAPDVPPTPSTINILTIDRNFLISFRYQGLPGT